MWEGGLKLPDGVGGQSVTPPPSKNKTGVRGGGRWGGRYQRDPCLTLIFSPGYCRGVGERLQVGPGEGGVSG